jgi:eukaryotic-like serine/threonine-protein kinase
MGLPRAPSDAACPSDDTVALFVDGGLSEGQERSVRLHVDGCTRCRKVLAGLAGTGQIEAAEAGGRSHAAAGSERVPLPLASGDIVQRKYRIDGVLGAGGMATVFRAHHVGLNRTVAIKVMHPELLRDTDATRRFSHEARAAAAIDHPHAVRILDIDALESGLPFLVMEYLEGSDLGAVSELGGPMAYERALRYLIQATRAVAAGHALGIVHRDLKPQNLFLTTTDVVKVVDFGLAKTLALVGPTMGSENTKTSVILGSPHYMSPEQVRSSRSVDGRTDIWALGATLFHLVAGVPPFAAPNLYLLCARILSDEPPSLARLRPGTPTRLQNVVKRCMRKQAADRYANADELAVGLEDALAHVHEIEPETVAPRVRRPFLPLSTAPLVADGPTIRDGDTQPMSHAETRTHGLPLSSTPPTRPTGPILEPPTTRTEVMVTRVPATPPPPTPDMATPKRRDE